MGNLIRWNRPRRSGDLVKLHKWAIAGSCILQRSPVRHTGSTTRVSELRAPPTSSTIVKCVIAEVPDPGSLTATIRSLPWRWQCSHVMDHNIYWWCSHLVCPWRLSWCLNRLKVVDSNNCASLVTIMYLSCKIGPKIEMVFMYQKMVWKFAVIQIINQYNYFTMYLLPLSISRYSRILLN